MDLIIGGAYQGKFEYARKKYSLTDKDIYICSENEDISFDRRCVSAIQEYTLYCVHGNINATEVFRTRGTNGKTAFLYARIFFAE